MPANSLIDQSAKYALLCMFLFLVALIFTTTCIYDVVKAKWYIKLSKRNRELFSLSVILLMLLQAIPWLLFVFALKGNEVIIRRTQEPVMMRLDFVSHHYRKKGVDCVGHYTDVQSRVQYESHRITCSFDDQQTLFGRLGTDVPVYVYVDNMGEVKILPTYGSVTYVPLVIASIFGLLILPSYYFLGYLIVKNIRSRKRLMKKLQRIVRTR